MKMFGFVILRNVFQKEDHAQQRVDGQWLILDNVRWCVIRT
jgi:hypothetical protein